MSADAVKFISISPDELHPGDVLVNAHAEPIGTVTRVHHIWGAICAHVGDTSFKFHDEGTVWIAAA